MIDLLDVRTSTMRVALAEWAKRKGQTIVETGCVRQADDWSGAGMSTVVFGDYIGSHGGHLWTVDNDQDHLDTAIDLTKPYAAWTSYRLDDSVTFLRSWQGTIDLLYLDSLDYPYGELLDLYGGKDDLDNAKETLADLTEAEVVARHGSIIAASQQHCAQEVRAALHALDEYSLVLIDDADLPGGGKARLARGVLAAAGFHEMASGYQTLWSRK